MLRAAAASLIVVFSAAVAGAQTPESGQPKAAVPLLNAAPTIDGAIDEAEWRGALRLVDFLSKPSGAATARQAVFWLGCDGRQLYLAVKSETPPGDRILTRAVPDPERDAVAAFHDDSIELVLDPNRGRTSGDRRFYHVIFNARGALYDWAVDPENRRSPVDLNWRLPAWRMVQRSADGWWEVEAAIPLASLGADQSDLGRPWGVQIARHWRRPVEPSQWSSRVNAYDAPAAMPEVAWDDQAPVVRVLSTVQQEKPRIEIAVANPHAKPLDAVVLLADAWHRDPPQELRRPLTVAPGAEEVIALDGRDGGPEGLHATTVRVTGPGDKVFFDRTWKWALARPAERWTTTEAERQALDLQFKYYPYASRIAFRVGLAELASRSRIRGVQAFVAKADTAGKPAQDPLWQEPIELDGDRAELVRTVPELAAGRYVFGVQLSGGEGVPREPVLQPFVREKFEWEHNGLGMSDEVMPPFTPLEAEGHRVRAVLREHEHGPEGLWSRVTSEGRPLLAAPMRFEVRAGGRACPVEGGSWQSTVRRPTEVRGQSRWTAGPVRATVDTQYDYDGMMLVTLELAPTGGTPVEGLSLVVPLDAARARFMHPVSDGLRHNYAGVVPPGEGAIWDSSKAGKLEIPGTFYPYIWIGDGQRGLCWFADTDRDWVLDARRSALELSREQGQVVLRVNFITQPGPLDRAHRIVFGLQATPTKPMPEGWRRWTANKRVEGSRPVRWLGACFYWGGLSYDVYPYRRQFEFYEKMAEARRTGEVDRAFVARWMHTIEQDLAPKGTDRHEHLLRHVNAGMWGAKSCPWADGWRLFGYTNPRGVGFHVPEFATFQDEWLRYRYFNRTWGKGVAVGYDVSPSASFQDYCLWYYRKMLDCFDGVYWDNVFLSANFDPVMGEAWVDEAGRIHPSLGLMHLRQLLKRTAVMLWQEGKRLPAPRRAPVTLAHMTNTMLVPVMSFINCTMDWEWKYGYEDFQDRFPPDLTVAETIGRQVGAWPTILAGGHWDKNDPRVDFMFRTRLGVCLTHEIQAFDHGPARDQELYGRLFALGYGRPECRVFNYWEEGHPVRVEGLKACTLAFACGPRGGVVVTDYGGGGTGRVRLDLARLGLPADVQAVDLESGQALERLAPGAFSLSIKKHDFRILKVER